jgi:hypothetical protein
MVRFLNYQELRRKETRTKKSEKKKKGGIVLTWHRASSALVLPQAGLTSEFEMGSGGTPPL